MQEGRFMEKVLRSVLGSVDKWGKVSIPTVTVARAMVNVSLKDAALPVEIFENSQIHELGK